MIINGVLHHATLLTPYACAVVERFLERMQLRMALNWSVCAIKKYFDIVSSTLLPWYNGILFNQPIELGYKHSYRTRQSLWFENIPLFKKCCGEQLHSGAHYNLLCFKMLAAFVIIYRHIFLDLTWLWLHAYYVQSVLQYRRMALPSSVSLNYQRKLYIVLTGQAAV